MKNLNKKSLTSMDWVISLSLFLLFVVWFFLILKPRLDNEISPISNIDLIARDVYNELKWNYDSKPIIIQFKENQTQKRFIKTYIGEKNITDIQGYFLDNNYKKVFWMPNVYSFVDEDYLFFTYSPYENVDYEVNIINAEDYNQTILGLSDFYKLNQSYGFDNSQYLGGLTDLSYNESYDSNSFLSVEYSSGILRSLNYENEEVVYDYSIEVNNKDVSNLNLYEYSWFNPVSTIHTLSSNELSVKSYLPRYSNEFLTKIYLKESYLKNEEVTINFELKNFTSYGFNNFDERTLNYNSNNCYIDSSSKLFLREGDLKTIISFEVESSNTNLTICESGSELDTSFEILLDNKNPILWQKILVYEDENEFPDYISIGGVSESKEGISDFGLNKMFSTEELFNEIQNNFDSFDIGLRFYYENKTLIQSLGEEFPLGVDVYSKQYIYPKLNFNGTIENIILVVNTW